MDTMDENPSPAASPRPAGPSPPPAVPSKRPATSSVGPSGKNLRITNSIVADDEGDGDVEAHKEVLPRGVQLQVQKEDQVQQHQEEQEVSQQSQQQQEVSQRPQQQQEESQRPQQQQEESQRPQQQQEESQQPQQQQEESQRPQQQQEEQGALQLQQEIEDALHGQQQREQRSSLAQLAKDVFEEAMQQLEQESKERGEEEFVLDDTPASPEELQSFIVQLVKVHQMERSIAEAMQVAASCHAAIKKYIDNFQLPTLDDMYK